MDRQTFLNRLAAELACWEDLLGSLRDEQVVAPAPIGAWSVRDVVVHVAFWTHHAAAHLAAIRAGRAPTEAELYGQQSPPAEVARDDDDAINAWALAQAGDMTVAQALDLGQQAAQRLCDALADLDDETVLEQGRQFAGLPWKGERTLLEVLDILTLQHAAGHREALEAWLALQPPPRRNPALRRELQAMRDRRLPPAEAEGMFADGWLLWPIAAFVEHYGLEHLDESLQAMHAITQRHTAEFAIRPFLLRYPAQTLAALRVWARDPSFHVRRLVSEGTRPRLPWAARLPAFLADPAPVLALLEVLKDDPSAYVRKSVANNLNDIAKDHPALVLATLARWQQGAGDERRWIIRHALRTLVKQGHPEALRLLGAEAPEVELVDLELAPAALRIDETLTIAVTLRSPAGAAQQLVVDYVLHLPGARGAARAKVFKLRSQVLAVGATLRLLKQHSFAPVTVRRLYPGPHRIAVQVNGVILGEAEVQLCAAEG